MNRYTPEQLQQCADAGARAAKDELSKHHPKGCYWNLYVDQPHLPDYQQQGYSAWKADAPARIAFAQAVLDTAAGFRKDEPDGSREAFEKNTVKSNCYDIEQIDGRYTHPGTAIRWAGWQAALQWRDGQDQWQRDELKLASAKLALENEELRGSIEDQVLAAKQSTHNAIYKIILDRLSPYFPKDSRDLDWDVLPGTLTKCMVELAELRDWKVQQMRVESEWDEQALAKALNVPLGQSCRKGIAAEVERLLAVVQEIFEDCDNHADGAPDASEYDKLCNEICGKMRRWVKHQQTSSSTPHPAVSFTDGKLNPPPFGRWQRENEWKVEDLKGCYRPYIFGEPQTLGDEFLSHTGEWEVLNDSIYEGENVCDEDGNDTRWARHRTRRPLPPAPEPTPPSGYPFCPNCGASHHSGACPDAPAEEWIPLGPEDIPPGSAISLFEDCSTWEIIAATHEEGVFNTSGELIPWEELKQYQILRPGATEFVPCKKLKPTSP